MWWFVLLSVNELIRLLIFVGFIRQAMEIYMLDQFSVLTSAVVEVLPSCVCVCPTYNNASLCSTA